MAKEKTQWAQFYWFDCDQKELPRVLLIGDEVVCGHAGAVAKKLQGKCTVGFFATGKIVGDFAYSNELALATGAYALDFIVFNNGRHEQGVSQAVYKDELRRTLEALKLSQKAQILWRSTPPAMLPGGRQPDTEKNAVIVERNRAGVELSRELQLDMLDIYAPMEGHPEYFAEDGVNFSEAGYAAQAELIAAWISARL